MGQGNGLVIVERDSRVKRYECLKIYVYVIMKPLSYIIRMALGKRQHRGGTSLLITGLGRYREEDLCEV